MKIAELQGYKGGANSGSMESVSHPLLFLNHTTNHPTSASTSLTMSSSASIKSFTLNLNKTYKGNPKPLTLACVYSNVGYVPCGQYLIMPTDAAPSMLMASATS
jgi:hypothetical protein